MIVHGFPPAPPLASPSPFCLKLELWLRLAGLPYRAKGDYDPIRAPKGKAPWVTLDDGTTLSDSSHIIDALTERHGVTLDDGMDDTDRATAVLLQRTIEEHLYFALLYMRWQDPDGWATYRRTYFDVAFPKPMRWVMPPMARRSCLRTLQSQGMGRHSRSEVVSRGARDLAAIAAVLADRPYALGDTPRSVDATVWSILACLHLAAFQDPLVDAMRSHPNLVAYTERLHAAHWG